MSEFGDELLRRMKRFTEQLKGSEEMNLDEALAMAENGNWHGFEHLRNAAKILADEVELLRAKLQVETAAADNLNEMLRRTGYGQGQIDAYDAQCVEIEELKEQLLDEKAEVVNLNEEIDEISAQLAAAKAEVKQHERDWCECDEAIKQQALRVLPKEQVEGDTWHVPRMAELAEMMADEIIAQLAAATELLDACKLALKDLTAWGIYGPGRTAIEAAIKKAVGELECE